MCPFSCNGDLFLSKFQNTFLGNKKKKSQCIKMVFKSRLYLATLLLWFSKNQKK